MTSLSLLADRTVSVQLMFPENQKKGHMSCPRWALVPFVYFTGKRDNAGVVETTANIYCRANKEWQWRNILFTIVK